MFDITSSKLLILAIVALIVVGPKDLPILLRTLGKYMGVVRRHAAEFRAQLDEAIREAELEEVKKEFDSVGQEMRSTLETGASSIERHIETARGDVEGALEGPSDKVQSRDQAVRPARQTDTQSEKSET